MTTALKYAGLFITGQTIKAFDFRPSTLRPDCYVEGKVIDPNCTRGGVDCYLIKTTKRVWEGQSAPFDDEQHKLIPHELAFADYDNRIALVQA